MHPLLESYIPIVGAEVIQQLIQIAQKLKGLKVIHVNSTREGGGVAEILHKLVPLFSALEIDTEWHVIQGNPDFFQCTKMFHNGIQGFKVSSLDQNLIQNYEMTNIQNANAMRGTLEKADVVFIHDPQPMAMISSFPNRTGKWIWRCHIDASKPSRIIWKYIRPFIVQYNASIFSLEDFVQPLPHPCYLVPPSIDPLSDKNIELSEYEIVAAFKEHNIDFNRPKLLQVSRFDKFKDPLGVIEAYRLAKKFKPDLQLILAGSGASDDPEGEEVLKGVRAAAEGDHDIHILFLPPDVNRKINALQRGADIVLQKSLKEGFGLTVTEALWKGKPVIGGNVGGICLQVIDYRNGFLVNTPEGAASRIRYLLHNRDAIERMGHMAKNFVRENFLITRHLREYLTIITTLFVPEVDRIFLDKIQPFNKK